MGSAPSGGTVTSPDKSVQESSHFMGSAATGGTVTLPDMTCVRHVHKGGPAHCTLICTSAMTFSSMDPVPDPDRDLRQVQWPTDLKVDQPAGIDSGTLCSQPALILFWRCGVPVDLNHFGSACFANHFFLSLFYYYHAEPLPYTLSASSTAGRSLMSGS